MEEDVEPKDEGGNSEPAIFRIFVCSCCVIEFVQFGRKSSYIT
jgi:hypothetical protein